MTPSEPVATAEPNLWRTRSIPNRHRPLTRVAALAGLSMLTVGYGGESIGAQTSPAAIATPQSVTGWRPAWHQPRVTFVDQPTPKQREIVVWAVGRFRDAGLQLPDLKISFPVICSGKGALYHVGKRAIDFCRINKNRALHEFAHAWDDTSGAVDRVAFLRLRGLSVWWGGLEMPSGEQGAEQLADIIAWGLMGFETRNVPQIPNNSVSELRKAFIMLTGRANLSKTTATRSSEAFGDRVRFRHSQTYFRAQAR
jgi:hypothetical protein